jgi:hypothetical protein
MPKYDLEIEETVVEAYISKYCTSHPAPADNEENGERHVSNTH